LVIGGDFLLVPVADAAGPEQTGAGVVPDGENEEDGAPFLGAPDGFDAFLRRGVGGVGEDGQRTFEEGLDGCQADAVFSAFVTVGGIPIEAGNGVCH
jgi:hypothetical protein